MMLNRQRRQPFYHPSRPFQRADADGGTTMVILSPPRPPRIASSSLARYERLAVAFDQLGGVGSFSLETRSSTDELRAT